MVFSYENSMKALEKPKHLQDAKTLAFHCYTAYELHMTNLVQQIYLIVLLSFSGSSQSLLNNPDRHCSP